MQTHALKTLSEQNLEGKVWAMQTDTVMGLCCLAQDSQAIAKIYKLKKRPEEKSFITLVGQIDDLRLLGIECSERHKQILNAVWPGPVSVALSEEGAYRLPDSITIQDVCKSIGPFVATSLNVSGEETCRNLKEAYKIFGEKIDYYVESEVQPSDQPSSIIKILR